MVMPNFTAPTSASPYASVLDAARGHLGVLFEALGGVPFAGLPRSESATTLLSSSPSAMAQTATMVTALTRSAIPGVGPGTAYESDAPGLGKSSLAHAVVCLKRGRVGRNGRDSMSNIASVYMYPSAQQVFVVDDATLLREELITSPTSSYLVMHSSEVVVIENKRQVLLIGETSGDLRRYFLHVRLLRPNSASDFRFAADGVSPDRLCDRFVQIHREELGAAAHSLLGAYDAYLGLGGRCLRLPPMHSFEEWSAAVREPLMFAAMSEAELHAWQKAEEDAVLDLTGDPVKTQGETLVSLVAKKVAKTVAKARWRRVRDQVRARGIFWYWHRLAGERAHAQGGAGRVRDRAEFETEEWM
jgi:hypothetical protein